VSDTKFYMEKILPLIAEGLSNKEICEKLNLDMTQLAAFVKDWIQPFCQKDGPALFAEVVETIGRHVHFEDESSKRLIALFVMQAHVALALPGVFYIAVPGAKGCGKTNLLAIVRTLTNGRMFENTSIAALARSMRYGMTVCIDEYDIDREKELNEVRDALVRQGYKADGSKYIRWDPVRNHPDEISVFGPKIVAYSGKINPALLDRSYVVPMEKYVGDDGYEFTRLGIWPELSDLTDRLIKWGVRAMTAYPKTALADMGKTPAFQEAVKRTTTSFGATRGSELATYATLVSVMADIDVAKDIETADEKRLVEDGSIDDQAEVRTALLEVLTGSDQQQSLASITEIRIPQKKVKDLINEWRRTRFEKPISDARFKALRRDIGIREAWVRNVSNRLIWAIPTAFLLTLRGGQANLGNLANLNEKPVQQDDKVSQVSQVSLGVRADFDSGMPLEKIIDKYGPDLVEREKIPKLGGRE